MRRLLAVLTRELKAYFDSIVAYVILLAFFLFTTWYTLTNLDSVGQASLRSFFGFLPVGFIVFVPALAMRLWSEERKLGTIEVLLTWPLRHVDLVLGKFLAGLVVLMLFLAMSSSYVVYVTSFGAPDYGPIIGGYVASLLLGATYLSLSCFISSLTENQIVAFVGSLFFGILFFLAGEPDVLNQIPSKFELLSRELDFAPLIEFLRSVGFGARFDSVARGVLDLGDLLFYLALTSLFLYLNVRAVGWHSQKGGAGSHSWHKKALLGLGAVAIALLAVNQWVAAVIVGLAMVPVIRMAPSEGARRWYLQFSDTFGACLLAVLVALQVSAVGDRMKWRKDLTEERAYSLSELSRNLARELEDPLSIRCYFSGDLPPILQQRRQQTEDVLDEYAAASNGKISVRIFDPDSDKDARDQAEREGIQEQTVTVRSAGEVQAVKRWFGCILEYRDQKEVFQFMPEPSRLESELTAALRNLESQSTLRVGFLTSADQSTTGMKLLMQRVKQARMSVSELDKASIEAGKEIPKHIDVLVLVKPDRLTEREAYEVDQFVMRGGSLLLLADGVTTDQRLVVKPTVTGLAGVLGAWGFELDPSIVRDHTPNKQLGISFNLGNKPYAGPNPFAFQIDKQSGLNPDHPATSALPLLVFSEASPVKVLRDDAGVTVLARGSMMSWSQGKLRALAKEITTFMEQGAKDWKPDRDAIQSPILALSYEGELSSAFAGRRPPSPEGMFEVPRDDARRTTEDETKEARIVIIGDSALIEADVWRIYGGNGSKALELGCTFVLNALDWLAKDEELIALRSRGLMDRKLEYPENLSPGARKLPVYLGPIALLLLFGLLRFVLRRRQESRIGEELRALAASMDPNAPAPKPPTLKRDAPKRSPASAREGKSTAPETKAEVDKPPPEKSSDKPDEANAKSSDKDADAKSDAKSDAKPDAKPDAEPDNKSSDKDADSKADAGSDGKSESKPDDSAGAKSEAASADASEAKAEKGSDKSNDSGSKSDSDDKGGSKVVQAGASSGGKKKKKRRRKKK